MMSQASQNFNDSHLAENNSKSLSSDVRNLNVDYTPIVINQKQVERGHELGDWFVFRETRHFGPLSTKQVNQFLLSRLISNQHHIWRPGFTQWVPILSIESFRSFGQNEIEKISDNDFSFQAQLGPIDRIKFQETDVSFQESGGIKILNINVQNVQNEINEKFDAFKISFKELLNELLFTFGINEKHKNKLAYAIIASTALFFISSFYLLFSGPREVFFVDQLPKEIRQKLVTNAELPENTKAPSLVFFEKDINLQDPVFVGSVNLPLGSKIKVVIEAVPETLLGSFRFQKEIEINLTSPYFQTEPIRGPSGQFLSAGKYKVSVTCLSCDKENVNLHSSTFSYGIKNIENYKKDLKAFHLSSRESAVLELDELDDLNETLLDQYQNTVSLFNRSIGNKSSESWNKFSANWLSTQKKIVELFEQIQSEELKSKLYYLALYESYGALTRSIFELHVMQDKLMTVGINDPSLREQISEISQDAKLKLSYLKSQTDLMRINYNRSSGLPSKEGLNLNNF